MESQWKVWTEDEISPKKIKTEEVFETLFDTLERAKNDIAIKFSNEYFEDSTSYYWLGEVLSINDEFIDLENIQYALENNIYEPVLFKYLSKPRNFNLEDYCLGKVGRKNKKKEELKKCKENVNYAWEKLQEAIADEHFENSAEEEYTKVLNTTGMFHEWFPQLFGNWEKDKSEWLIIYREMSKNRNSTKRDKTKFNKFNNLEDID